MIWIRRVQDARERARRCMPGKKGKRDGARTMKTHSADNAPSLHPSFTASYQNFTPAALIGITAHGFWRYGGGRLWDVMADASTREGT
jgi:hypothetical protein